MMEVKLTKYTYVTSVEKFVSSVYYHDVYYVLIYPIIGTQCASLHLL